MQGYKAQNRAMEGDEVVIRVLPPDQWYQLTSTKQAQQGQQQQAAPAAPAAAAASNVVPAAGLAARARAGAEAAGAAAAPPAAESEAGVAPPAWSGAHAPPAGAARLATVGRCLRWRMVRTALMLCVLALSSELWSPRA